MRLIWVATVVATVACGCTHQEPASGVDEAHADVTDPWSLLATDRSDGDVRLFNATLGVRIPLGSADARDEALLFREDRLLRFSTALGSTVTLQGKPLEAGERFTGVLHLRDGTWRCRWQEDGVHVQVTWVIHPLKEALARRIEVAGGRVALRVLPPPVEQTIGLAWVSERDRSGAPPNLSLRAKTLINGRQATDRVQTLVSDGSDKVVIDDLIGLDSAPPTSFTLLREEAARVWEERWRTDIEIEAPVEDQRAVRACLFQLYAGGNAKLPPFGASNAKYGGHRFWDAEAWMLPIYALFQPDIARAATDWRVRTVKERLPAWETGADGADVAPPSHKDAIHIWGWVHWWLDRAEGLSLVSNPRDARKAKARVEEAFLQRATRTGRGVEFQAVLPPDEGRTRDNDLVTNLLARRALSRKVPRVASEVVVPRAQDGIPCSWDGDHLKGYQQTSALLALYPLEWHFPRHEAEAMFERYVRLTSPNGPAMSDSIHATIAARFAAGREESSDWKRRAYALWRESWTPYLTAWGGFRERRKSDEASFMTGAAGCLQTVVYGFAGLQLVEPGVEVSGGETFPLAEGWRLVIRPALPPAWRSVTLRGVWLLGHRYTIHAGQNREVTVMKEGEEGTGRHVSK